ncbi:MAG: hypothetical protein ACSHX8_09120 [Opitutaceae bacterium]
MQQYRALILRSNRFLGSSLVDKGLLSLSDLELANEKFMASIQKTDLKHASILNTLVYDLKVLDENQLIKYMVEDSGLSLIDLTFCNLQSLRPMGVDMDLCWATSTVPFDKVEDTYMLASCYYLSAPVVKQWEEVLKGHVIWYATTCVSMTRALEKIEAIHESEDEADEDDED